MKDVGLEVRQGEVYALLGPNGAGKTTLVEILEGHRQRTAGRVEVLGYDPESRDRSFRQRIGIVLQEIGVEPFLSVAEAIELYRGYYPNPLPLEKIIKVVGLGDKRTERVNRLSGGQRRRLDVAIGLAGDPELLFLDEPTTGFDPGARRNAWEMIQGLAALGKTVFLTTHYMDEAQALADRVGILVEGRIVAEGSPRSLIQQDPGRTRVTFALTGARELPDRFRHSATILGAKVEIETVEPMRLLHELTGWAIEQGCELAELRVSRPSLEDVYLNLTEREPADPGSPAKLDPGNSEDNGSSARRSDTAGVRG